MVGSLSLARTVMRDGERYPVLLNAGGAPCWYPTLYATTQLRNNSKAPSTITSVLAAIRLLLKWCEAESIDLETRLARRDFLAMSEVENLCRYLQSKAAGSEKVVHIAKSGGHREAARSSIQTPGQRVVTNTQYIRLTYVADYLDWLAHRLVEREARHIDQDCQAAIKRMVQSIRARRPKKTAQSNENKRQGLTGAQHKTLLSLVEPGSDINPFSDKVQVRNKLIVHLLDELGLRQGELLSIRIPDIDFSRNEIVVPRRHDDPDDPRKRQPVAKTMDRRLPIKSELAELVSDYVIGPRRAIKRARRNDFLLVVHKAGPYCGNPMSSKGIDKVFRKLREAQPAILDGLSSHILRHTWNDRFSELVDAKGMERPEEAKLRSYLMGWKEGSGTAAIYTRRHTRQQAKKAALRLQGVPGREDDHD